MTQMTTVPRHVAVIMDGNGRWAKAQGFPRLAGHQRGSEVAREIVRTAADLGVKYITLFAFSSENWRRDPDEVSGLMALLKHYLETEIETLHGIQGSQWRIRLREFTLNFTDQRIRCLIIFLLQSLTYCR